MVDIDSHCKCNHWYLLLFQGGNSCIFQRRRQRFAFNSNSKQIVLLYFSDLFSCHPSIGFVSRLDLLFVLAPRYDCKSINTYTWNVTTAGNKVLMNNARNQAMPAQLQMAIPSLLHSFHKMREALSWSCRSLQKNNSMKMFEP